MGTYAYMLPTLSPVGNCCRAGYAGRLAGANDRKDVSSIATVDISRGVDRGASNSEGGWLLRGLAAVGVLLVSCLVSASPALAAGEYELNDSRETAHGPLAGGTFYTAGIETVNDVDWYVFYVRTHSQVEFTASAAAKEGPESYFYLYDRDGGSITGCCGSAISVYSMDVLKRYSITMTPGRYYLRVGGGKGARYKFRIDPAPSLTTSRECGEAIVAKDLVAPQLAAVAQDLAENAEELATKAAAVQAAKKEQRQTSRKTKRLKGKVKRLRQKAKRQRGEGRQSRKLRRVSAKLRLARGEARSAADRLNGAKEMRRPVWQEKLNLEAVAGQHHQVIAGADAQIAIHC